MKTHGVADYPAGDTHTVGAMHVLVTGGAGFIGSHVVEALASAGHEVRVLDALLPCVHPGGVPPFSGDPGFEFVHGDVRDAQTVDDALRGINVVCHLAAMVGLGVDFDDAPLYAGCNDLGTAVLLAAMARARSSRLVMASSMVVYGEGAYSCAGHGLAATPPPRQAADLDAGSFEPRCERCGEPLSPELVPEEAPLGPRNVYADTKVAQEHLAGSWARATEGHAVALRYHNVYGPGMPRDTPYAGVASFFRSCLEAGRAPRVFEDGAQLRDFVHVRDVAGATVTAVEAVGGPAVPGGPGALRAYNVGSGTPRTVGQLASALASAYGGPRPVVTGEYRLGDVRHVAASSDRISRELGWRAAVPFAEGVAEFATVPAGRGPAGRGPAGRGPAGRVPA
ncbi:MAG: NAD-dependent epimerase/dehydratase family protein [Actinomycetia bacterium]|nr:NAD-dependent epimerase/dehydratase family protein [Actinomycetes bacterium]